MPIRNQPIRLFFKTLLLWSCMFAPFRSTMAQSNTSERLLDQLQHLRNASCQIVINGTDVCTGVLLNSTNESKTNYILSAAHCIQDTTQIESISLTFGGHPPLANQDFEGLTWSTSFGVEIRAIDYQQDYVLYELIEVIPRIYSPYYLGWNAAVTKPALGVTFHYSDINASQSALKRTDIEIDDFLFPPGYLSGLVSIPNGFWKVPNWTAGSTAGGASGAGLIDQNENYLGGLTGSTVSNKGNTFDYFFRFDLAYSDESMALKDVIDPLGKEKTTGAYFHELYKVSTYSPFDSLLVPENLSLTNTISLSFGLQETTRLRGMYLVLGDLNIELGKRLIVELFERGERVMRKNVTWHSLNPNAENFIEFETELSLLANIELRLSSDSDAQLEEAVLPLVAAHNSAARLTTWNESDDVVLRDGIPMIAFLADHKILSEELTLPITFFPNPTNDFIFVSPTSDFHSIEMFNLNGELVHPNIVHRYHELMIDVSTFPVGIYIIRIFNDSGQTIHRKIIKN